MADRAEEKLAKISTSISHLERDQRTILEIDMLTLLGRMATQKGKINQGIDILSDALSFAESANYAEGIAEIMINLGNVQWELGEDVELAREYFQEALAICTQNQDKGGMAKCLNGLGVVDLLLGAYKDALYHFQEYKIISRELGNRLGESIALNNTAEVYRLQGELDNAEINYKGSLKICHEIRDYDGVILCHINLGWVKWGQNDLVAAINHLQQALEDSKTFKVGWATRIENLVALAGVLTDLAKTKTQDYSESEKLLEKALNYAQSIGSPSSIALCRYFQGYLERTRGNLARAEKLFSKCLTEGSNFDIMTKSLLGSAEILLTRYVRTSEEKYLEEFMKQINKARKLAKENQLLVMLCEIHVLRGLVAASKNNYEEALAHLTQAVSLAEEKSLFRQKERAEKEFENILKQRRMEKIETGTLEDEDALKYIQNYLKDVTEILKRRKGN